MAKPVILCVDDQREVLAALVKDLDEFADLFELVEAEQADEATSVLEDLVDRGRPVALIISDHVMPGVSGVDFLASVDATGDLPHTRKLLLTGLATHQDTIRAINEANVDRYVAKPWDRGELVDVVRRLVSGFIFDTEPDDYQPFLAVLHPEVMLDRMKQGPGPHGDR